MSLRRISPTDGADVLEGRGFNPAVKPATLVDHVFAGLARQKHVASTADFNRLKNQRGATLLEFALVAAALLLIMFVIIDFGRAAYVYHFVSVASAQGARYGAVRGATYSGTSCSSSQIYLCDATLSDIQTYVSNQVSSGIYVNSGASSGQPGYLNTAVTWPGTSSSGNACVKLASAANSPGCAVQVTVTYTYGFTLPLLKFTNITMTSSSEMDISQ